jgi:hypothetical protein
MAFLPTAFELPRAAETARFRLRPITIHDAFKDYDAVMSSRERLWQRFGAAWGWPPADLTIEQNIVDLGWHQKEFQLRSSFDYALMSLDEARLLGCVYVDPPEDAAVDAEVWFWVRDSEIASGLEAEVEAFLGPWLGAHWPFATVRLNGCRRRLRDPG